METFGDTTTSDALDSGVIWPMITLPHFEKRAASITRESYISTFGIVPLVGAQDRTAWEFIPNAIKPGYNKATNETAQDSIMIPTTMTTCFKFHLQYTIPGSLTNKRDSPRKT
jgi:hypothetical protein